MDAMRFSKGHGTGNDFVILPDPEGELVLSPKLVAALCDRRFGIGGDGVLRVVRTAAAARPADAGVGAELLGKAEWFMDYHNADGSVAEMCGNGARVFARYLVDTGLVATGEVTLGTRAGPVVAVVAGSGDDDPGAVSVSMRAPRITGPATVRLESGRAGGVELSGVAVDCGNPHLVCALPAGWDLAELDLSRPPVVDPGVFPAGVNVEFIAPPPGEPVGSGVAPVRMRVYERGVGETLSCGSGAVAVAAVVLREAGHDAGHDAGVVTVDVPGGRLVVSLTGEGAALTGPAVLVAHGTIDAAALAV